MQKNRIIEYAFFFSALTIVGLITLRMIYPFITALALASITVVICYPMFRWLLKHVTRQNRSVAALLATLIVFCAVVTPVTVVSTLLIDESLSFYQTIDFSEKMPLNDFLVNTESFLQIYFTDLDIDLSAELRSGVAWFAGNLGSIFAGTLSIIITFLVAILGSFYLFKDGERLVAWLVSISPLKDAEDKIIIERVAKSIRSVATGTVLVAILQGCWAGLGFYLTGIPRPILWGTVGALGALLPGLGTLAIIVPGILYLLYTAHFGAALFLSIWGIISVIVIDNFISPHLLGRGNNMHPFVVLLAVLGGISLFGPIGFIVGPVMVSLFFVLLELYTQYLSDNGIPVRKTKTVK